TNTYRRVGEWTFAQMVVSRAVDRVRQRAQSTLSRNTQLADKLNALKKLSFGQAYEELFGQADTFAVLGDGGAFSFGGARTFEQAKVALWNMDPVTRAAQERALKTDARYVASKRGAGYTLEDMERGEVHAFRVFVDALLEAANTTLKL